MYDTYYIYPAYVRSFKLIYNSSSGNIFITKYVVRTDSVLFISKSKATKFGMLRLSAFFIGGSFIPASSVGRLSSSIGRIKNSVVR